MKDVSLRLQPDFERDPRLDALFRNSAVAFASKFEEQAEMPPLRVEFGEPSTVDAASFGRISTALQESTATLAKGVLFPAALHLRSSAKDRERAPLVPLGSMRNTLLFTFPPSVADKDGEFALDGGYTLTEAAVKELVTILPRALDDRASIDVLPSQAQPVRKAIRTLAEAVKLTGGVKFTLDLPRAHEHLVSVLSADQARSVGVALSGKQDTVTEETVVATLDGVRTQRRIFYLVREDGSELKGSVGPELMPQIREFLGRKVAARLQKVVVEYGGGGRSRPTYRLLSLSVDKELLGAE